MAADEGWEEIADGGHSDTEEGEEEPGYEEFLECHHCHESVGATEPRCPSCGSSRAQVVLSCAALALELAHGPGAPLRLGRDPDWAPRTAAAFDELRRISRRQAEISMDPDGTVWVSEPDRPSTNRTFVNGEPVAPGGRTRLRDGDELRFGQRIARFTVRITAPPVP
ncbi:FHA domain-containing protein [Streptomyces yaizuensis]|uniref:FHA domain-containing protein n=1 Tax=Streptomyces yaizuensis TaxID=2989713 RepID=A0ABQ5P1U9_9ACTN|nr:FHA domain-containing protein [Streptomyces sp. YSPA8]GLF96582.1 FHA domain-containing protein [Streptomyces sp. YSPA8]